MVGKATKAMSEVYRNEFENYPSLAMWMERLANANIEGMSLVEWDNFCSAVNVALILAEQWNE